MMVAVSLPACSSVTPGLSRPTTRSQCAPRMSGSSAGSKVSGVKTSASAG